MSRTQKVMVAGMCVAMGILWSFAAAGCNTVRGAGQDVRSAADRTEQMFY